MAVSSEGSGQLLSLVAAAPGLLVCWTWGGDESQLGWGRTHRLCGKSAVRLMQQVRVYQSVLTKPQLAERCGYVRELQTRHQGHRALLPALQHLLGHSSISWAQQHLPMGFEVPGRSGWGHSPVLLALGAASHSWHPVWELLQGGGIFVPATGKAQGLQELISDLCGSLLAQHVLGSCGILRALSFW